MAGPLSRIRLLGRERARRRMYQAAFATPEGQYVLRDLSRLGGLAGTTFVPGDPYASAFNEGMRNLVCVIHSTINVDPEITVQKIVEGLEQNGQILDDDD